MHEAAPLIDDVESRFELELLRNERLRATLMAGFFAAIFVAMLAGQFVAFAAGPSPLGRGGHPDFFSRLSILVGTVVGLELLLRHLISERIQKQRSIPRLWWYMLTVVELGLYTAGLALAVPEGHTLPPGLPPQIIVFASFVVIATLRLHFFITVFTGLVAASCYIMLLFVTGAGLWDPVTESLVWGGAEPDAGGTVAEAGSASWIMVPPMMVFFLGLSVLAGYVAQHIRQRTLLMLSELSERLRLEREVLNVASKEQRRIGRDLHDGLGSHLTGLSMQCRALAWRLDKGASVEQSEMEDVAAGVEEAINQARLMARGLSPVKLGEEGLLGALEEIALSIRTLSKILCTFEADEGLPPLSPETSEHLYRIVQEATNNAIKHASPDQIYITLQVQKDALVLRVRDDGKGLGTSSSNGGIGLRTMAYRARLIGADLRAGSASRGRGTEIRCVLPLDATTSPHDRIEIGAE